MHILAVSAKINRLDDAYLQWLVTTKWKTGGINYSRAITHGTPTDRGNKPNQAAVGLQQQNVLSAASGHQRTPQASSSVPVPQYTHSLPLAPQIQQQTQASHQLVCPLLTSIPPVSSVLLCQPTVAKQSKHRFLFVLELPRNLVVQLLTHQQI